MRDRLVQRAIVDYLVENKRFPAHASSYGFVKGLGVRDAISKAMLLRKTYDWCLKTDIEAFFDRIPRQHLKAKVSAALRSNSLTPLIFKVIDCEIKDTPWLKAKLRNQGVLPGVGIRQGMPLSPILANLALSNFDSRVERASIEMIRYADDILLFFRSKADAVEGHRFIKSELAKLNLGVPDIDQQSKTAIVGPRQPVDFLGREIVYLESEQSFVSRVSRTQIAKLKARLENDFNYETRTKIGSDLQETIVDLSTSISVYLGVYKDAYNFFQLDAELRYIGKKIVADIFLDIFGENALDKVSSEAREFIGIGDLQVRPADLDF